MLSLQDKEFFAVQLSLPGEVSKPAMKPPIKFVWLKSGVGAGMRTIWRCSWSC